MKNSYIVTLAAIVILTTAAMRAEAKRKNTAERNLSPELLIDDHKTLRLELDSACVEWACPTYLGKRLRIFYGSRHADSTIYVTTARSSLKNASHDTIRLPGPLGASVNTGIYPVVVKESDNYPLFAYSSENPFEYIIHENNTDSLNSGSKLQTYFNRDNGIIKIISDGRNSLKAFYLDKRFGKGVIMSISSADNGKTWGYPVKTLSSNTESFEHATMSQTRRGTLYILTVTDNGKAYISTSKNNGKTWTYPKPLSEKMDGESHSMTIHRSGAFIVYKHNPTGKGNSREDGNYMLWTSSVKDLENGAGQGIYRRILRKDFTKNSNIKKVDLMHLMNNRYLMTVIFEDQGKCVAECYKFAGNFYL